MLAARILVDNHQKNTPQTLLECVHVLCNNSDLLSENYHNLVCGNAEEYEAMIDYSRDFMFDYFGFKTLERSYLLKKNGKVIERPQHMWMRVAIQLHESNYEKVKETYDALSQGYFIHATPTLFNSGTKHPQLSSCFLLAMADDSIQGIYKTLGDCAQISKWAGGIGLSVHNIRARGSLIKGTNGESTGLVPMLKVFNDTAKYVNQGGKRNGSFAIYLEPWHADIEDFLKLKLNQGAEEDRARDLFYGLWIPDLFMQRVEKDEDWTLMCPSECPGLADCWGDKFEELYLQYESSNKGRKTLKAKKIWQLILDAQIQTGTPYLCYKDAVNSKSNQQHLGTIKSSNLCTEIMEFTSPDETAVCNLGSLALPKFVEDGKFNFEKLRKYTSILARNLDIVIDKNFYPTPECRNSNKKHRPIGIGIQGLADVFAKLRLGWTSSEAKQLNREIFENIYFAAMEASMYRTCEQGVAVYNHSSHSVEGEHKSYYGSPLSQGKFQFDLWNQKPTETSSYLDWNLLKIMVKEYGVRNSLLVAPMPTASTSQILGNNECFEPFTSNIYTRRVLAGDFMVVNKYLVDELTKLGLWTSDIRTQIISDNGSIQNIREISQDLKDIYKTVWEIPQKTLVDMAADRAPFICQSQSLNLFLSEPTYAKISSMHMYAWKKGLKTGCYYLRTKAVSSAQKFTVDPASNNCLTCSS
jgi:ribonucleoside-diphosphate reductase alpha chain